MKKALLIISTVVALVVFFTACSVTENESETVLTTAITDENGETHYFEIVTDAENQTVLNEIKTDGSRKPVTNKKGAYEIMKLRLKVCRTLPKKIPDILIERDLQLQSGQ